ncbi:MAG: hypothetical protein M3126_08710 [Candidatus Eremiobacteraeota bacterium]|nr:hypothetical protein [Candidatus Eremiobacteraeota bacterium]
MFRKTRLAATGALSEPSVVQQPAARLFLGVPNALLGAVYYTVVLVFIWGIPGGCVPLLVASALAAGVSFYLAYSLLFVTRMPCKFCWTSHAINWLLVLLLIFFCKLT